MYDNQVLSTKEKLQMDAASCSICSLSPQMRDCVRCPFLSLWDEKQRHLSSIVTVSCKPYSLYLHPLLLIQMATNDEKHVKELKPKDVFLYGGTWFIVNE